MPHSDPLLLELFAIFVWAKVFGEFFEQVGLPAVLGEILAGIILGPYATHFVNPGPTTYSVAEIGAIFLLFTVGLETMPKELIRVGRMSLRVALAGIIAPFALGFVYLRWIRGDVVHEAVFVAAAMVATSVGITARVMGDMHVLHTRVARIILGAAVFDDILGMILLAVVAGLASVAGVQWVQLIVLFIEAVAFALGMIFFGPRVIAKMRPGLERMSTQNAPLILSLAICLGLSVAAERIGMAAIIGAFFAGMVFAEYSKEWNLQPRVNAINEFLAPYFFFTLGARLDLRVFSWSVIGASLIITALAIIGKVAACGVPVLSEGMSSAIKVGVGMTPRGEVALIVAVVGLQMNMISQPAYAIVLFMTGATTLLAPPLLRYLFRQDAAAAVAS
jgi:Kef-type K+ transport system membrane component KefB